jgi:formylmethanofuran dehydrogenase subunit B
MRQAATPVVASFQSPLAPAASKSRFPSIRERLSEAGYRLDPHSPASPPPGILMRMSTPAQPTSERQIDDAVCLACGCMCDDISVTVVDNRVTCVKNACPIGEAWFRQAEDDTRPICRVDGREASLEEGIAVAARLLTSAKYPLIYGLGETTCEAQQKAVAIADGVGATIDTATSFGHAPSSMAFQNVGKVTCSFGEIKNRGDLVIFWGANPAGNQPRLLSQYTLDATGMFILGGRRERTCVVIDVQPTETSQQADHFIALKPGSDFEALCALRLLAKGVAPDGELVGSATGVPLAQWQALFEQMRTARYGAILFGGGLTRTGARHNNCEWLLRLVREMNDHTRFVCCGVRQRGNVTGADKVVTWQTGYPFCVNLARGYPRYNAQEYTAGATLARREADVALVIGNDPMPDFTPASHAHLASIPVITLAADESPLSESAAVSFATCRFGLASGGTVYRLDEVPLHLRPAVASQYPTDAEVLSALEVAIRALLPAAAEEH